jgi:hypothetical protein
MFKINEEKDLIIHIIQMMRKKKKRRRRRRMNLKILYRKKMNLGMRLIYNSYLIFIRFVSFHLA